MTPQEINEKIRDLEYRMEMILDMPEEFQTDDIWDEYADLEIKLGVLESLLEEKN